MEELREQGHETRMRVIGDLDVQVARSSGAPPRRAAPRRISRRSGGARRRDLPRAGAKLAAKSKSMVSEEIGLNGALEAAGIRAVETDLGEYILQLAGEHPVAHHRPRDREDRRRRAELSATSRAGELPAEVEPARARRRAGSFARRVPHRRRRHHGRELRRRGDGSICLVTNEGNGGSSASLPRVHIALIGMERLVPTARRARAAAAAAARSGTGQKLTRYTTLVTGPRRHGEQDGPEELHVVIVDNGRRKLLRGATRRCSPASAAAPA